ncbi:MAG: site-2 protease family protein [Patescibacteria group bacterium]
MEYLFFFVILIFSIVIHEVSHGFVADKMGDPTARLQGRLTLNPLPHLDMVGSIILPLFLIITGSPILFGWAKPVPFDPFNLKNPRKDSAIISMAGPLSNLTIAVIFSIIARILLVSSFPAAEFLISLAMSAVFINVILGVFNLIPIHPLDGFKVVGGLLSEKQANEWYQLERYGIIFLLALLFLPVGGSNMLNIILGPVIRFILNILLPETLGIGIV